MFTLASATLAVETWTMLFDLSVPLFPNLRNGNENSTYFIGMQRVLDAIVH